jgi:nitrate reductase delta subunit
VIRRPRQPGRRSRSQDWRVVHQVASWCLDYPDAELVGRLDLLRQALDEQAPSDPVDRLRSFVDHAAARPLADLVDDYVRLFDLSRRQTLYLTYWTDGDTRRRGGTLAAFKQRYRDSGFACDLRGELPDHLPLVLEYAAVADAVGGRELLEEHRASIELIRLALVEQETAYADVLTAVCGTLPGPSPTTRAGAMALASAPAASGPPVESVGIEMLGLPTLGPPAATEGAR